MTRVVSVRVPDAWSGVVNSERARVWVTNWLSQPVSLSQFPAPGPYKLNLRLSDDEVAKLKRLSGKTASLALRGILALNVPPEPAVVQEHGLKWLIGCVASGIILLLMVTGSVGPRGGHRP
jgi:hypothetical protein